MKTQWHNSRSVQTKTGAVLYRIGERPWRSSDQPTLFITFWQVLRNNRWRSNKHNEKKNKNQQHLACFSLFSIFWSNWHFSQVVWHFWFTWTLQPWWMTVVFCLAKSVVRKTEQHFLEIYLMPFKSISQMHLTGNKSFILCLASLAASNSKIVEKFSA